MSTQRIRRLAEASSRAGIDALVIMPGANLHYLMGLSIHMSERLALGIIPTNGDPALMVLPMLEQPRAQTEYSGGVPIDWFPWNDDEGPRHALRRAASGLIGRTVGIEYIAMRVMELRALEEAAGVHVVDITELVASLRMRKDSVELEALRKATQIVETGLRMAIESIRPGRSEREIAAIWEDVMKQEGSAGPSFSTIVASGPNSANPHHTTGDRIIQEGDLIILDGGATYGGYCSDITRTVAVGQLSTEQETMYDVVRQANQAGFEACRPGVAARSVDRAARSVIETAGLGQYFIHRTGHGLGMEIHEPPYISSVSNYTLAPGTVFTVEPGVYKYGIGGVRIEDMVVITEAGAERLTTLDRGLRVLT